MHIVYVSREYPPSLRGGGIASYLKIVAEGFAAKGHRVTVIAANDDTSKECRETVNCVDIIRLSGGDFLIRDAEPSASKMCKFRFLYRFHSYRKRIAAEIRKLDGVDIIEVAEFGAEGLYLNSMGIPVVYRLHTPALLDHDSFSLQKINRRNFMYYFGGKIELDILRKHAKFVTSCSSSLKEWVSLYCDVEKRNIEVIYNPLQRDFIQQRTDMHYNSKPYIFFAGTICDWKGSEDLIKSCEIVNESGSCIPLYMAGKIGSFGEQLRNTYSKHQWLHILGKLPHSELKTYYSEATVVCFPSWWENMPMVCIEAMSLGAIVIGSNSGGMSEIIEDGVSGFLLPPKSPELWASKIKEIISMPLYEREKISKSAIRRIKDIFSLDIILEKIERYYSKAFSEWN